MSKLLGGLVFDVIRLRRKITLSNLDTAFGSSLSSGERVALGRKCYRTLALSAMEMADLAGYSEAEVREVCSIDGLELLEEALAKQKGVVLVTGHFGNWELLAASFSARGIPLTAVAARMKNPRVNDWIRDLRERFGMELIRSGKASGRRALKALKAGRVLLLLIDQNARRNGAFIRFFDILASTRTGAATLAQRTGSPIIPCRIDRKECGHHTIIVHKPLSAPPRGGGEEAVLEKMQEISTILEGWIREDPSGWFWPHRRFKTRPPLKTV